MHAYANHYSLCQCTTYLHLCLLPGVCNTDNFSLLSVTIDYGPFGFMDNYNPGVQLYLIGPYNMVIGTMKHVNLTGGSGRL